MTKYKLNEDKIFADIADGIAILINIDTGIYYGMNKLGTLVYENFLQGVTAESILEKLKSWNAESEKGFNEYMNFINEHSIMLKESGDSDDREVFLYEEIAKEDGYIPTIAEYKDAQELLLADPIHEVKEDKGWTPEKSSLNEDKEDVARREAKMGIHK